MLQQYYWRKVSKQSYAYHDVVIHCVMQCAGTERGTGLGNETGIVTEVQDGEEIAPAAENGTAIGGAVTDMISMRAGVDGVKTQIKSGGPRGMSTSSMTGQLCIVFHALLVTSRTRPLAFMLMLVL